MTDFLREVLNHEGRITRFFLREQLPRETIEDLTQETLCRLFEGAGKFRGESSPGTWIYGVCRNVLREHYRRERKLLFREEEERGQAVREELIHLRLWEETLPPRLRIIYEKKYRQDRRIREIAEELSLPEGTVKYHLYRIRAMLREQRFD